MHSVDELIAMLGNVHNCITVHTYAIECVCEGQHSASTAMDGGEVEGRRGEGVCEAAERTEVHCAVLGGWCHTHNPACNPNTNRHYCTVME
jgi:hypothetical protein